MARAQRGLNEYQQLGLQKALGESLRAAIGGFMVSGTEGLANALVASVQESTRVTSRQLLTVAELFERSLVPGARLRRVHEDVGRAGQDSMLKSYDQTVTAREKLRIPYREGEGRWPRFPHKLREALAKPEMVRGTEEGIDYVHVPTLDAEAVHWHRLNFGAAPAGEGSQRSFPVTWAGVLITELGFDEGPSQPFMLPKGFWVGPGGERQDPGPPGTGMFYPVGELPPGTSVRGRANAKGPTRGIEARNFLDAGLRTIADRIGPAYSDLYGELWQEAKAGAGPLTQIHNVVPPRPYRQRFG